jgi:hypothetical protein
MSLLLLLLSLLLSCFSGLLLLSLLLLLSSLLSCFSGFCRSGFSGSSSSGF